MKENLIARMTQLLVMILYQSNLRCYFGFRLDSNIYSTYKLCMVYILYLYSKNIFILICILRYI